MTRIVLSCLLALCGAAAAVPVPLVNPSGEINNGIDRTVIPHHPFTGWEGANGQTILGGTHGGNGAWRMSVNPGGELRQRGSHLIQTGSAFSLRFDAAPFSGLPPSVTAEFYTEPAPGTVNVLLAKVFNFPHEDLVRNLPLHQPDLYAFTGDQVYEGGSPTTQDASTDENRRLDYLYKWYLFCWTFRDLIDDRPSIALPDDHDVFQGNLWGEGGKATATPDSFRPLLGKSGEILENTYTRRKTAPTSSRGSRRSPA